MSESTWHETILPPTPSASAPDSKQGTAQPQGIDTGTVVAPVPKRNHNRSAEGKRKPGPPRMSLTIAQKQEAVTLAASGYSTYRISETIGKSRMTVKRHLEEPETIAKVEAERAEMVQLCRDKARDMRYRHQ